MQLEVLVLSGASITRAIWLIHSDDDATSW